MALRDMGKRTGIVASLKARGFDTSHAIPFQRGAKVGCSQCEALAINGHATHEQGCPNAVHECLGCNEMIPLRERYCSECL
jgi:hypothetical protein